MIALHLIVRAISIVYRRIAPASNPLSGNCLDVALVNIPVVIDKGPAGSELGKNGDRR